MKAIVPIYNERFLNIESSVYSIIHDYLREYTGETLEDCLETLNQEAMGYVLEGQDYVGILAVLYELSEWAKDCGYHFSVNNVEDMDFHLSCMGIKLTKPYSNEECVVEIDADGYFELLDLLKIHWARMVYGWEFDYEFPEKEEDINIQFGPLTIKPWYEEDAEYFAKQINSWSRQLDVQYPGPNVELI